MSILGSHFDEMVELEVSGPHALGCHVPRVLLGRTTGGVEAGQLPAFLVARLKVVVEVEEVARHGAKNRRLRTGSFMALPKLGGELPHERELDSAWRQLRSGRHR